MKNLPRKRKRVHPSKGPHRHLWKRYWRDRDKATERELMKSYIPYMIYIVRRTLSRLPGRPQAEDYLANGSIGLLHSIRRYDPDSEYPFETYAQHRIRGSVLDQRRNEGNYSRSQLRQAQENGEDPVATVTYTNAHYLNYSAEAKNGHAPMLEKRELAEAFLDQLEGREKSVMELLFFSDRLTVKEIANVFGVTDDRIWQIRKKCLRKLREHAKGLQKPIRAWEDDEFSPPISSDWPGKASGVLPEPLRGSLPPRSTP